MAIALKTTVRFICLLAVVVTGIVTSVTYAAEAEEEESYYLSQMRDLANNKKDQPEANVPAPSGELMAETDLKKMAKAAGEVEEIDDVSPSLTKPSLPSLKPDL